MAWSEAPYTALLHRIREEALPAGVGRSDWRVDIDTLLGLHARRILQGVKAGVRSRTATFATRQGPIEADAITVSDLHDLLDAELGRIS